MSDRAAFGAAENTLIEMAKKTIIGALEFASKTAAKAFFRAIRDSYENGERVSDEHASLLKNLVAIHPEAEMKVGAGISHFTVERDSKFGTTRHFTIHRVDGSDTDVSFNSPIDGRNLRRDRLEALRRAVEGQVLSFRRRAFESGEDIVCPLAGVPVTEDSYHVDHTPPTTFLLLVKRWLRKDGLSLEDVCITPPADNQIVTEMTNEEQAVSWQSYHLDNAVLRLLSPIGNLSNAKRSADDGSAK